MNRFCIVVVVLLLIAVKSTLGQSREVVLFDGTDTKGWHQAGPGGFDLKDRTLVSHGGMGLFWHEAEFSDFVVTVEYKVNSPKANSGVFVRFRDPGNDPW